MNPILKGETWPHKIFIDMAVTFQKTSVPVVLQNGLLHVNVSICTSCGSAYWSVSSAFTVQSRGLRLHGMSVSHLP